MKKLTSVAAIAAALSTSAAFAQETPAPTTVPEPTVSTALPVLGVGAAPLLVGGLAAAVIVGLAISADGTDGTN